MMADDLARYLGIVQLKSDSTIERIREDVPKILDLFTQLSNGEQEQAFRSSDGLLFGILFKSSRPGPVMRAEFDRCYGTRDGDAFLVFEAGELATGQGFSRAWTWLQRH
jgi:hypothetical protein